MKKLRYENDKPIEFYVPHNGYNGDVIKEILEEMNKDYAQICKEEAEKDRLLKLEFRKKLKGLINVPGLFKWLDEHDKGLLESELVK